MHVGMTAFFQNPNHAQSDREVWAHELAMADLAEPLGFDSVWAAEHHFTDYHMLPSVTQFLTWVAARTQRVKLGSMVVVLPWHDPVRVAEEFSVLDHMSGGRAMIGIGRGLARVEFEGFRREMGISRQTFVENAEALLAALEGGDLEHAGEFYRQPRVAIRPAPFASFRGRTYASVVSPASAPIMAKLGIGLLVIAQKPWETVLPEIAHYREVYREVNGCEAPKPLLVSFVAVHPDEATAQEMFERYIVRYCHSTLEHYEFHNAGLADVPGYEYYGKLAANIEKHGKDQFTRFLAELQVWGTPDQVVEKMLEHRRMLDSEGVIGAFSYGGMPSEMALQNMRLFASDVMPRLRAAGAGVAA